MNKPVTDEKEKITTNKAKGSGNMKRDQETVKSSSLVFRLFCSKLRKVCKVAATMVKKIQVISLKYC